MTYSPEDPRQNRDEQASASKAKLKSLDSDEWIAILVAFGVIGSLFFWSLRPQTAANGGGWLRGNGIGLVGDSDSTNATLGGATIATGSGDAGEDADAGFDANSDSALGPLTSPSSAISSAVGSDKNNGGSLLSRRTLTGAAAGAAAGGAIAAGADGADAGEVPAAEPAVTAEASIPTPAEEAPATEEAPAEEPAAAPEEAAAPLQVASEALDTSVPEIADDSWVAPFAQSLTKAERFGALPTPTGEDEAAATFDIDAPVTRAEFAALINEAEQANGDAATAAGKFADIEETFWAAKGIAGANKVGFMKGVKNDSGLAFQPGKQIPRWQVFVTLASGLNLAIPDNPEEVLSSYDTTDIPDWAKGQVAATLQEGLVVNPNSTTDLEAGRPATRGEATAMLQLVLERQGKVDPVDASSVVVKAE